GSRRAAHDQSTGSAGASPSQGSPVRNRPCRSRLRPATRRSGRATRRSGRGRSYRRPLSSADLLLDRCQRRPGGRARAAIPGGDMSDPARRREVFSNPFFVVLLGTSLVFVLTILGYLVSPYILVPDPGRPRPGPNSVRLADWFDRNGPVTLAAE